MTTIETRRLVLRDFTLLDLGAYRRIRDDVKFQRFYSEDDACPDRTDALLKMFVDQALERPRTKYQFAVLSRSGELMGSCGVRLEGAGRASVGCELARTWHGSGAALEAAEAVIDFGFRTLNADCVYAETLADNKAALRLCGALGMRIEPERTARTFFRNRWWTTVVLSMSAHRWRENESRAAGGMTPPARLPD